MARARSNSVRIIGGDWRGRRLRFPAAPGLRPTADRRRETLFNWLGGDLSGLRCLDLFAGSGALGFEAASRGAERVVLVEAAREIAAALSANRDRLATSAVQVVHAPMARYLDRPAERFDGVFLDPPFAQPRLAAHACQRLADAWLADRAWVYLEIAAQGAAPTLPAGWRITRRSASGDVHALLVQTAPE